MVGGAPTLVRVAAPSYEIKITDVDPSHVTDGLITEEMVIPEKTFQGCTMNVELPMPISEEIAAIKVSIQNIIKWGEGLQNRLTELEKRLTDLENRPMSIFRPPPGIHPATEKHVIFEKKNGSNVDCYPSCDQVR